MSIKSKISFILIVVIIIVLPLILAYRYFELGSNTKYLRNIGNFFPKILPAENKIISILSISPEIAGFNKEKAYLLLFQNNLEIRPTGGFIGSYGIVKLKDGKILDLKVEGSYVLDRKSSFFVKPPQVMQEHLKIKKLQFRDCNWCPDFPTTAKRAVYFYNNEGGKEKIDGVIAINPFVLVSIINEIGPICENDLCLKGEKQDIINLEHYVEKIYAQKGIQFLDRKLILKEIAKKIKEEYEKLSLKEKLKLLKVIEEHLDKKDILVYFFDKDLQSKIEKLNWAGKVKDFSGDYLMIIDSNFLAKKTDYYIKRFVKYKVDLTKERPLAHLEITYTHTGEKYDWMTSDYRNYLRVYVPKGSWLVKFEGGEEEVRFLDELNKTVFGNFITVKLKETKTIVLEYLLPSRIKKGDYKLLVQKQSGILELPLDIEIVSSKVIKNYFPEDGRIISAKKLKFHTNISSDKIFSVEY